VTEQFREPTEEIRGLEIAPIPPGAVRVEVYIYNYVHVYIYLCSIYNSGFKHLTDEVHIHIYIYIYIYIYIVYIIAVEST